MFEQTLELAYKTLSSADLSKDDIDEVVLVGGSTRIPYITELLQKAFVGKPLNRTLNPDEAVAYGAAVMAAMASGVGGSIREIRLADVIPMTLGLTNANGTMIPFVQRNTRIPVTKFQSNWTTVADYQTSGLFSVYEGEDKLVANNNFLGSFCLNNLEVGVKGTPKIYVSFTVDSNGILHVDAVDTKTRSHNQVAITADKGRLSEPEIITLIKIIQQYEEADDNDNILEEEEVEVVIPVSGLLLQRYCYALRLAVGSRSRLDRITDGERDRVHALTGAALDVLQAAGAGMGSSTELYGRAMAAVQKECAPMLAKLAYLQPN